MTRGFGFFFLDADVPEPDLGSNQPATTHKAAAPQATTSDPRKEMLFSNMILEHHIHRTLHRHRAIL